MKTLRPIFAIFALSAVLASCSTSNDVVGGVFQKRKYNKGFYWNKGSHIPSDRSDDVAKNYKTGDNKSGEIRYSEEGTTALAPKKAAIEVNTSTPAVYNAPERNAVASSEEVSNNTTKAKASTEGASEAKAAKNENASQPATSSLMERKQTFGSNTLKTESRSDSGASDVAVILLVIIAIFLPWLAVLLYEGATGRFWVVLIIWLLAFFAFAYPIASLLFLIAFIYALLIVLGAV
jgi:uncharacterized membrane protein YqaE (UPF0057 family)